MLARPIAGTLILLFPAAALGAEAGDAARGERAFQRCYSCHSVDPNEAAKLQGPSLYRIMGRQAAAIPDFAYSDAMRKRAPQGSSGMPPTSNAISPTRKALWRARA